MTDCPICQHAKITVINSALASGRSPNLVRAQFRLDPQMLADHIAHRSPEEKQSSTIDRLDGLPDQPFIKTSMDALQPALPHIRRASRLVKSYDEYQALVVEINDALCDGIQFVHELLKHDDMGLP